MSSKKQPAIYERRSSRKWEDGNDYQECLTRPRNNYKQYFISGMRSVWATKHTEDTADNRQLFIKTTIRELIVYIVFLVVIMIISIGMSNGWKYYYQTALTSLFFTPFSSGVSVDDFWSFLQGPLMAGLYWTQWYNNASVPTTETNYVMYANKLIGVPRLRQVRVRNDSCAIVADFQSSLKLCYAPYSLSVESTDPFGLQNSTAWNYTNATTLNGRSSDGFVTSYGGGGYYIDLNKTQSDSLNTLGFLFNNYWIDRGTRAVMIDFTVYNADLNLFCVIKLIAEFPATGGMIPSSSFRTVKLIRYSTPTDYVVMAFELVFLVYIIYYIVEESIEIKKHKCEYFFSFWNCLDLVVLGISLASVGFNIYRTITINNTLQTLLKSNRRYANFDNISYLQIQFDYIIAFTLFSAWIKIFKYISFNKTMNQLNVTLGQCAYDLSGFAVMFIVIFLAFAQLAYLLFGTQVDRFCSFVTTVFSLLRLILGDFDFSQLDKSNRVLGVIFFVIYVFFVIIVLFQMFMAIIVDTYGDVKEELAKKANEFEMTDYIRERAFAMMEKLNLKISKVNDIQNAMDFADTDGDNKINFEEWKTELRKRGYEDAEIEAVFRKYDIDGDLVLDEDERKEMQIELETQKAALNKEIKQNESDGKLGSSMNGTLPNDTVKIEHHQMLKTCVTRVENKVNNIVTKIEWVLKKIGKIEKKSSRKAELLSLVANTLASDEIPSQAERNKRLTDLVRNEMEKIIHGGGPSKSGTKSQNNLQDN